MFAAVPAAAMAPGFADQGELSSDTGHILLTWQSEEPVTLTIAQEPDLSDSRAVYQGGESSYFMSGLSNGDYFLRLEGQSGALSAPVKLSVAHQSLEQALWLTAIGLLITLGIVATILKGARND